MPNMAKLKNGTEELRALVQVTMAQLHSMLGAGLGVLFYELVCLCRDSTHKPWGQTGEDLASRKLVTQTCDGYQVHESIRNIVLSAAEGDDLEMSLVNPVIAEQMAKVAPSP